MINRAIVVMIPAFLCVLTVSGCGGSGTAATPVLTTSTPVSTSPRAQRQFLAAGRPADLSDGWRVATSTTMLEAPLDRLLADIDSGQYPFLDGLAVAHRGELIAEYTFRQSLDRFDVEVGNLDPSVHLQFSVSKGLGAMLVGVAIDQGDLAGVDVPYLQLFPYPDYQNQSDEKLAMTLEDVLTMRLGLDWDEFEPGFDHPDNQLFSHHRAHSDWTKGLLDLPMVASPGEVFAYNTVASTSLGQAIENSQPLMLEDYAATYLLRPLQIVNVAVLRSPTGLPDLGRGLFLSARDVAKFGQVVLNEGLWNGVRVLSADWIEEMTVPRTEFRWLRPQAHSWQIEGFGYQWWLGYFEIEGQKYPTVTGRGFGGQLLVVVPELELVVALNSRNYEDLADEGENVLFTLIRDYIVVAALGAG